MQKKFNILQISSTKVTKNGAKFCYDNGQGLDEPQDHKGKQRPRLRPLPRMTRITRMQLQSRPHPAAGPPLL